MQGSMTLYSYFRSSASYRVRIALHYKHIPFKYEAVHLLKDGGYQFLEEYKKLNPQSQVPCLIHNGKPLSQSMAIIQYLEETFPNPSLFPNKPYERALVVQICEAFNSGIQPMQNLAVLNELEKKFAATQEMKAQWVRDWNARVLTSVEKLLEKSAGDFAYGDSITAADCFLVPHVFSTKRYNFDLSPYPKLLSAYRHANEIEAFKLAAPERQPDYEA